MKRIAFFILTMLATTVGAWADGVYFTYDPSAYEQQTHVFVALADRNEVRFMDPAYTYYVGAFIGNECRYEAIQQWDPTGTGAYFDLMVGGKANEVGQHITFRVYRVMDDPTGAPTLGTEYWLDESQYVEFNADDRSTDVSNPKLLIFEPVPSVMMQPEIQLYKGQTINLLNYVYKESWETLPVITWDGSQQGGEYYTLDGNMLTAVNKTTEPMGVPLIVRWGDQQMQIMVQILVKANSVKWLDEYSRGITVPVGDNETIDQVLATGYVMTPADASTTFSWTSDNEDIVRLVDTNYSWTAMAVGATKLKGTANDDSGLTLELTVTVIQPVTTILLSQYEIYAEVGEDITDRLNALVTVYPETATNKAYTWTIDDGNNSVKWENGRFIAKTLTNDADTKTMTVTAQDGYGATAQLTVNVVPVTPKELTAKQATLYMTNDPSNPYRDCTAEVLANLQLTPSGLLVENYNPTFESSDPMVISVMDGPENVQQELHIEGQGTTTITARIFVVDYTDMNPTGGTGMRELVASFDIVVRDGLGSFVFDNVEMTKDETYTLTITPSPAGSTYDPSKVSIAIEPFSRVNFPAGWTFVQATATDDTKLVYTLDAKSVGTGTIKVNYDGAEMGSGSISVAQRLTLNNGWQWISLYEGQMTNTDMRPVFGDSLMDIRSQDAYLINDSQLGYFGALNTLNVGQTYKMRMRYVSNDFEYVVPMGAGSTYMQVHDVLANPSPAMSTTLQLRKGWNWVGNIYQYYQKLSDVLAGNTFQANDLIKSKTGSATYNGTSWVGNSDLNCLTPGDGILIYVQNAMDLNLVSEFTLNQQHSKPLNARSNVSRIHSPWTFDHSRFENNMAMIARVNNVNDPSRVTVWAFVDGECRGQGEAVGNLQFITVHGVAGERVTFRLYDELTGMFHEVIGSRILNDVSGSLDAPVLLYSGQATSIEDIEREAAKAAGIYDLQGRKANGQLKKGVYIQNGRKVVK